VEEGFERDDLRLLMKCAEAFRAHRNASSSSRVLSPEMRRERPREEEREAQEVGEGPAEREKEDEEEPKRGEGKGKEGGEAPFCGVLPSWF